MEQILKKMAAKYEEWEHSPNRQKSGYEYEKTFTEMWQSLGSEIFQESLGALPKDKNGKKNFKPFGAK